MSAFNVLKWLAVILMVGDHVDAVFLNRQGWYLTELGRVAMPLFAGLLGFNLARKGAFESGAFNRVIERCLLFALLAYVPHIVVFGYSWSVMNILFAFAAGTAFCWAWAKGDRLYIAIAGVAVYVASSYLEFGWTAPLLLFGFWQFFARNNGVVGPIAIMIGLMELCRLNGNLWALWSLPLLSLLLLPAPTVERRAGSRTFFYAFYAGHLVALLGLRVVIGGPGV